MHLPNQHFAGRGPYAAPLSGYEAGGVPGVECFCSFEVVTTRRKVHGNKRRIWEGHALTGLGSSDVERGSPLPYSYRGVLPLLSRTA